MSLKKFFEQHLQLHTLRIELNTGRVLLYQIDGQRKAELEEWMRNPADTFSALTSAFLSFYSDYDRFVFIRISALNRIIFLWDPVLNAINPNAYTDPFDILETAQEDIAADEGTPAWLDELDLDWPTEKEEQGQEENEVAGIAAEDLFGDAIPDNFDEPDIPDAIVLLQADPKPLLFYDLDEEVDCLETTDESGINSLSPDGRFISFADADGEQNYMPVENILCLDVSRRLVFDDNRWEEMERKRSIDNNTN